MKNCQVCNSSEGKYKCRNCYIPYCSVECYKKHTETPCTRKVTQLVREHETTNLQNDGPRNERYYEYGTADTVKLQSLQLLGNDKALKDLLVNPHLREILKSIDSTKNPREIMQMAMVEPIFREFSDACLRIIEPTSDSDSE